MILFQLKNLIRLSFFIFSFTSPVFSADINLGKNKASSCQGCHGVNGNSKTPQYPRLAGQRATYIEAQLKAFQTGMRTDSTMQAIATSLNETDIKNISIYFSSLTPENIISDSSVTKKGQNKFSMCAGCHGATAQGRGRFPKLAGQQPEYLKKQLLNFKNNSRKGGPMNAIASSLSEQDINEIAEYLGGL